MIGYGMGSLLANVYTMAKNFSDEVSQAWMKN